MTAAPKKKRSCALKHPIRFGRMTLHLTDEGLEQFTVCQWLELHKVNFCAIPNGGKTTAYGRLMAAALGQKAGAADLFILDSPPIDPLKRKGVFIEMKSKTGKATDSQREWLSNAKQSWYATHICNGADEAISILKDYGYGGRS